MSILACIFFVLLVLSLLTLAGFDGQVVAFLFGAVAALIILWVLFLLAPFIVFFGIPALLVWLVVRLRKPR